MRITLIFLAILLGISLAWIVRQTINVRPWVAQSLGPAEADKLPKPVTAERLALAVFLAVITSFFMLSVSSYFMRMELGRDWIPVAPPALLWLNTVVLVLASVALQLAWNAARRFDMAQIRLPLLVGGGLTLAFIGGQAVAWSQMHSGGNLLVGNPASSFFYLITALHAVHLFGGLVAWARTLGKMRRAERPVRIRDSVELCAVYWHYLLLLWLGLFGLLMST